jgi:hypothetical protein
LPLRLRHLAAQLSIATCLFTFLAAAPAARADTPATHTGLTWGVLGHNADHTTRVGITAVSDEYHGDAAPAEWWPVLCLHPDGSPAPGWLSPTFFQGWAQGSVALTPPVPGYRLTSQAAADGICQAGYGAGWREATMRDGHWGADGTLTGNWTYWAAGSVPDGSRFWVSGLDSPVNPWS